MCFSPLSHLLILQMFGVLTPIQPPKRRVLFDDYSDIMSPFSILDLPLLAMQTCLTKMSSKELIHFSLCSKKAKEASKIVQRKLNFFMLSLAESVHIHIQFENEVRCSAFVWKPTIPKYRFRRRHKEEKKTKQFIWHMCEVFQRPIDHIYLTAKNYKKEMRWLYSHQPTIRQLSIAEDRVTNKEARRILDDTKVSLQVYLFFQPKANFQYEGFKTDVDVLYVKHSRWITVQNLMDMNCLEISLKNCSLTDHDINAFLRSWTQGSNQRLRWFSVSRGKPDEIMVNKELIKRGLNAVPRSRSKRKEYEMTDSSGRRCSWMICGGFDITRHDGKVATLRMQPSFDGVLTYVISLCVW